MFRKPNGRVMGSTRRRIAALGVLLLLVLTAACSAASSFVQPAATSPGGAVPTGAPAVRSAAQPQVAPVPGPGGAALSAAAPNAPQAAATGAQSTGQASDATVADTSAQILDRMVIRTAQLTIEVQQMESALARARDIATRAGGFVSASNTHVEKVNNQDQMVADLTLQVSSASADSAISELRALGNVTSETTGSQDVTEEYVDLQSNLRNLQASEAAILKLMDKATQIQDVLSLQRELTNVRGQIERLQGRKTYLERRTDMATITLSLRPQPTPSPEPVLGGAWDPVATAQRGWQASLGLLRGAADVVIVVLAFSWWLVPFIGLGIYAWIHRRRPAPRLVTPADPV